MSKKQLALFDDRFLEAFAGTSILQNPIVAVLELIANAWDAGATRVEIKWPEEEEQVFLVRDNGHGMTEEQFQQRYRKLAYNRLSVQGVLAELPKDHLHLVARRAAYGRNGKGRLAGFAFGESFWLRSHRDGHTIKYEVRRDTSNQLAFYPVENASSDDLMPHGTEVLVPVAPAVGVSSEVARREIGMRFLTDPNFGVVLNGVKVSFTDVPDENVEEFEVDCDPYGKVVVTVIDVQTTDRTTHQHGIAWWAKGRLVGECTWKGSKSEHLIDGRRVAAKRYIFIVKADQLSDVILPDWTDFLRSDDKFKTIFSIVEEKIKERLLEFSKAQREETFKEIETNNKERISAVR